MWRKVIGLEIVRPCWRRWLAAFVAATAQNAGAQDLAPSQLDFASNYNFHYGSYQLHYTLPPGTDSRRPLLGIDSQLSIARLTGFDLDGGLLRDLKFSTQSDASDDWRSIRYGLRVDLDMPASGRLYLNVGARPNARRDPLSYRFSMPGIEPEDGPRSWALGVFVEGSRNGFNAHLGLAPQMNFRLDRLLNSRTPVDVSVQYSSWQGAENNSRALQAKLRWKF